MTTQAQTNAFKAERARLVAIDNEASDKLNAGEITVAEFRAIIFANEAKINELDARWREWCWRAWPDSSAPATGDDNDEERYWAAYNRLNDR